MTEVGKTRAGETGRRDEETRHGVGLPRSVFPWLSTSTAAETVRHVVELMQVCREPPGAGPGAREDVRMVMRRALVAAWEQPRGPWLQRSSGPAVGPYNSASLQALVKRGRDSMCNQPSRAAAASGHVELGPIPPLKVCQRRAFRPVSDCPQRRQLVVTHHLPAVLLHQGSARFVFLIPQHAYPVAAGRWGGRRRRSEREQTWTPSSTAAAGCARSSRAARPRCGGSTSSRSCECVSALDARRQEDGSADADGQRGAQAGLSGGHVRQHHAGQPGPVVGRALCSRRCVPWQPLVPRGETGTVSLSLPSPSDKPTHAHTLGRPCLGLHPALSGPYAPAVLRFLISFPDSYPQLPPRVSFSTDMFHPLITPLSTYMYTTDIQDNGTVSASDDERLPPGAFSLRHGFPDWFGHGRRTAAAAATSSSRRPSSDAQLASPPTATHISPPVPASSRSARAPPGAAGSRSPYDVLRYVRSTFDDERVLDSVPLDAAGNPGAWHAWRTHRRKLGPLAAEDTHDHAPDESAPLSQNPSPASPRKAPPVGPARHPGEWNWAGVWEDRVRRCIAASLSEPALYGAGAGPADDLVRASIKNFGPHCSLVESNRNAAADTFSPARGARRRLDQGQSPP